MAPDSCRASVRNAMQEVETLASQTGSAEAPRPGAARRRKAFQLKRHSRSGVSIGSGVEAFYVGLQKMLASRGPRWAFGRGRLRSL
jgi:hypothetical protein